MEEYKIIQKETIRLNEAIERPTFSSKIKPFPLKKEYRSVVPLKIFTTWHTKHLPPKMQENWDALKSENPEFEHYLYDDPAFKPLVVVGRSPNTAELQLVIPIFARTVGDEVVAEYASAGVTDYACAIVSNDLLRDPGQLSGFPGLLFEVLKDYDRLRIVPVKQEDISLWGQLLGTAPKEAEFGRHAVVPGSPYKVWRNINLGKSRRSQLDRKTRRLSDRGNVRLQVPPSR